MEDSMSQEKQELSTMPIGQLQTVSKDNSSINEAEHLVPVSEAIKYRKRAQAAEQQLELLSKQFKEKENVQEAIENKLNEARQETELTQQLVLAGATDVEAALLLTQKQLRMGEIKDVKVLVSDLREERPYLFSDRVNGTTAVLAGPTAVVHSNDGANVSKLSRLAHQAQNSGTRKDMQEYLRLRRSMQV